MNKQTTRRDFLGATGTMAATGLGWALSNQAAAAAAVSPRSIPKMKITRAEPVMTGSDVFVRIETDAGIVGYGDATNHFLPYSAEGALKEMIPYLILECHGRYDPEWAIELARLAAPYRPLYIEDPVRHENPEALKRVREHTDIPLAIGERYHSKYDCREAVINQWVDYLRPDVCHCGGITEMMRIAALADVFYITLIPHNNAGPLGSAATLHAALAIPNLTMIEAPWANGDAQGDVVKPFPTVENGYALPLDGPGLGVTFDEDRAKAKPFRQPGLQPRLNATDGSVRDF